MAFARGNLSELGSHGVGVNNEFWEKLLSEIDTNNDGAITFDEFEEYMLKLIEQGKYLARDGASEQ